MTIGTLIIEMGPDNWDRRVKHVMEETRRTQRFKDVCEDSSIRESAKMQVGAHRDTSRPPTGVPLQILGQLIDEAHASMSGSFEASCPEIDSLAAAARRHGALGARVFGAGMIPCGAGLMIPCGAGRAVRYTSHAGWGGCVLAVLSPELEADFVQVVREPTVCIIPYPLHHTAPTVSYRT
eukprot:Polyplicarium_translucidae@DN3329_c1_g1_i3.p2